MSTPSPMSSVPSAIPPARLFARWNGWLARIHDEFSDLLIQRQHFRHVQELWNHNLNNVRDGRDVLERGEICRWMVRGYIAYSASAVRRLAEAAPSRPARPGRQCISLAILLAEIRDHAQLFTRERLRRMYVRPNQGLADRMVKVADRVFDGVVRNRKRQVLSASCVQADLDAMARAMRRVDIFVNKTIAHHERDRRRVGRPLRFGELERAIQLLLGYFRQYSLFISGKDVCFREAPRTEDYLDIRQDLLRQ